ncbi:MAG: hypothetical protein ACFCBW_12320 [Candidatus Competibacterales bacterium]
MAVTKGFGDRLAVDAVDLKVREQLECLQAEVVITFIHLNRPQIGAAARVTLAQNGSDAMVLGCAGTADLAMLLSAEWGVPVVKLAKAAKALGLATGQWGAYAWPREKTAL